MWTQRWIGLLALAVMLLVVSACSDHEEQRKKTESSNQTHTQHQVKNDPSAPLKVEIDVPAQVQLNQELELKALLTQGNEPVNDAQEVQFEIWKEKQKKTSEKMDAKLKKDGIYVVNKKFQEEGIYYIQAHATARGMHVMPVKKVVVGEGNEKEKHSQEQTESQHHPH